MAQRMVETPDCFKLWQIYNCSDENICRQFVDSVLGSKPFSSVATSYGTANEKVARNMYRKQTNNHVPDCGLVIHPDFLYIGASPDGKVCDNGVVGIIEIKCPFSIRDSTVLEALADENKRKKLCVEKVGENVGIKETHPYWYQVQGQLLVTGAQFCDFVVYTRQDLFVLRIMPDKKSYGVYTIQNVQDIHRFCVGIR